MFLIWKVPAKRESSTHTHTHTHTYTKGSEQYAMCVGSYLRQTISSNYGCLFATHSRPDPECARSENKPR